MSWAVAVYLGVAALGWGPCVFAARRISNRGRVDLLVTAAVLALGWPITLPLFATTLRLRRDARPARPKLQVVRGALVAAPPAADVVGAKH